MKIEFNDENKGRIVKVAENLRGTCQSLDDALQAEFGEDTDISDIAIELLQELDDIVMLCEACGWWCEVSEMSEQDVQICVDCEESG